MTYVIYSPSLDKCFTAAGTWGDLADAEKFNAPDDLDLPDTVTDARFWGPLALNAWGEIAECQL